jgi:archaeal flagellar protein FlaI
MDEQNNYSGEHEDSFPDYDPFNNPEIIDINLAPPIPALPIMKDKTTINVRYAIVAPFSTVHIYWDERELELKYDVEEPLLDEYEDFLLVELKKAMDELINVNVLVEKTPQALISYIDRTARLLISELSLDVPIGSYEKIFYYLYRDFVGMNEIDVLMKDYFIEDIECNGANTPIFVIHRVYRNLKTNIKFDSIPVMSSLVEKMAQKCGRYISYASPILDGSLPDGSRVNATYTKDITSKGPTFTIRKFTNVPWTPTQLISFNTMSPEMMAYFWMVVQYQMSLLIAGGTASGKTTLLNAIAFFIPPELRVVSIEDTRELNLPRENWLPSVSRGALGVKGVGEVDLFSLLKASFRQAPDYVIVGEVRGKETFVLFQGMASGHSSISTIHADSVDTVIRRLSTPPIELSPTLINTLDVCAIQRHVIVNKKHTRRVFSISEIVNVSEEGVAEINTPFIWEPKDDKFYHKKRSVVFDKIEKRFGLTKKELEYELLSRTLLLNEMCKRGIFDFHSVQKVINGFYKDSQEILKRFGVLDKIGKMNIQNIQNNQKKQMQQGKNLPKNLGVKTNDNVKKILSRLNQK